MISTSPIRLLQCVFRFKYEFNRNHFNQMIAKLYTNPIVILYAQLCRPSNHRIHEPTYDIKTTKYYIIYLSFLHIFLSENLCEFFLFAKICYVHTVIVDKYYIVGLLSSQYHNRNKLNVYQSNYVHIK